MGPRCQKPRPSAPSRRVVREISADIRKWDGIAPIHRIAGRRENPRTSDISRYRDCEIPLFGDYSFRYFASSALLGFSDFDVSTFLNSGPLEFGFRYFKIARYVDPDCPAILPPVRFEMRRLRRSAILRFRDYDVI